MAKCLCGCRRKANTGKKYIHGHNRPWLGRKLTFTVWNKGKKGAYTHSEETKKKISSRLKGKMPKNLSLINANKNCEGNPAWKGDKVGYGAVHSWVKSRKLKKRKCQLCGKTKKLYLANISGKYMRDINDYEWLCQKCHVNKDLVSIRTGKKPRAIETFIMTGKRKTFGKRRENGII